MHRLRVSYVGWLTRMNSVRSARQLSRCLTWGLSEPGEYSSNSGGNECIELHVCTVYVCIYVCTISECILQPVSDSESS